MPSTSRAPLGVNLRHHNTMMAQEQDQKMDDALRKVNTDLKHVTSERDRFQSQYEQVIKKLTDATRTITDLKSQLQALKDDNLGLKHSVAQGEEEYQALELSRATLSQRYSNLKASYDEVLHEYGISGMQSPTLAITGTALPERPKSSHRTKIDASHKNEHKEHHREERGRGREKERGSKDKKSGKEVDAKPEKTRHSRRFDAPPLSGTRRNSFAAEGRPPSSRSLSAAPVSRGYVRPVPGLALPPTYSQPQATAVYSNVPRSTNPMTPAGYARSLIGTHYDDGEVYEDGNYHPYPIAR